VSPDGSRVYVTNQGKGHLSVINTVTNTVVGSPIPVGRPEAVAVSPDGSRVYVVGNTAEWPGGVGTVSVIDTATNTVVVSPMTLGFFAEGVAVTPDGSRLNVVGYTDEPTGAGRMSVIDTATNTVLGSPMKLGDWLEGVVVTPDGSRVYVSDRTFEGVWVVAIQPPKAPTRVKAVAGNFAATVSWVRPPMTYKVIDYKVLAYDAAGRSVGKSCTVKAPALSCTVKELKTATNYKFRVQARSAVGTSARSAYSNTVVPKPRVRIALKAVDSGNKLLVDVDPNLAGTRYWSFRVQKKVNGRWVLASRTYYTTQTSKETRTLNLSRGTYRVVVYARHGYSTTYAPTSVSLRR
jgi:YVTN family beta-propeller protein